MTELEEQTKPILEDYYTEVKETLENTSHSYVRVDHLEIDGIAPKKFGKVLKYLAEEDIIDIRSDRSSGPNLYDLTGYDTSNLERLAEEKLELE